MTTVHAPPAPIPDFRNLGVLLRTLVLAELLRLLYWSVEGGWRTQGWLGFLEQAVLYEPVLLTTVLCLAALQPVLGGLPYRRAVALVLAVAAGAALAWQGWLQHGLGLAGTVPPLQSAWVAVLVSAVVLFYFNARHHRLSPALAEARVTALQSRIRPHFLFNSLNSVLALLRSRPQQAEAVLQDLADLYRALLSDVRTLVPLAQELQLARAYVDIEAVRLGERLRMHWLTAHAPDAVWVPPLLLQPLLENAVRYGVEPSPQGADVTVEIYAEADRLLVFVRNTLPPEAHVQTREGNHMALGNIRERLELHFDAEAQLKRYTADGEHVVMVRLPRTHAPPPRPAGSAAAPG
jgi:two-component system, LytTR family, sensor histidine kinase AlgZ